MKHKKVLVKRKVVVVKRKQIKPPPKKERRSSLKKFQDAVRTDSTRRKQGRMGKVVWVPTCEDEIMVTKVKDQPDVVGALKDVNAFLARKSRIRPFTQTWKHFICDAYVKVFGDPVPGNVPITLVGMAVAYELQYRGMESHEVEASEEFKSRRDAAIAFDLTKYNVPTRCFVEWQIKEEAKMATVSKERSTRAKSTESGIGKGVHGKSGGNLKVFYTQMFNDNVKKKLTDEQMAKLVSKEFPDRPHTAARVAQYRITFNAGTHNFTAPKTPLPRFDEKGNVVTAGRKKGTTTKKGAPTSITRKKVDTSVPAKKVVKVPVKGKVAVQVRRAAKMPARRKVAAKE